MEKNNDLMSGKGEGGKWITVNGSHIFIEEGQSVKEALTKNFDKKQSESARLKKILTERNHNEDEDFAKDTNYFGFGSLDALEEAHKNNYQKKETINQDKVRDDKYTDGNPDNIIKISTKDSIFQDLKGYKGSGKVDLALPGGKWAQITPQKDGTYLCRSHNGKKYVKNSEDAKAEILNLI